MGKQIRVQSILFSAVDVTPPPPPPPPPPGVNQWASNDPALVLTPSLDGNQCVGTLTGSTSALLVVTPADGTTPQAVQVTYDATTGALSISPAPTV